MKNETSRKLDIAFLIIFPCVMCLMAVLALNGYSRGEHAPDYAATTQIVAGLALMIIPIMRLTRVIMLPYWFFAIVSLNIILYSTSLFFGFYTYLWWWDEVCHAFSSLLVTMIAFVALCIIEHYTKMISLMPKSAFLFMVFMIGVAFGNIWEMWEGAVDQLMGVKHMQEVDAFDTLSDLLMDIVGAAAMVLIAMIMMRRKTVSELAAEMGFEGKMVLIGKKWDRRCGGVTDLPPRVKKKWFRRQ